MLSSEHCQAVKECAKTAKETCQGISTEHKEVHAAISKFGRAIDKVCVSPLPLLSALTPFPFSLYSFRTSSQRFQECVWRVCSQENGASNLTWLFANTSSDKGNWTWERDWSRCGVMETKTTHVIPSKYSGPSLKWIKVYQGTKFLPSIHVAANTLLQ